jgi:hypothetical protein
MLLRGRGRGGRGRGKEGRGEGVEGREGMQARFVSWVGKTQRSKPWHHRGWEQAGEAGEHTCLQAAEGDYQGGQENGVMVFSASYSGSNTSVESVTRSAQG